MRKLWKVHVAFLVVEIATMYVGLAIDNFNISMIGGLMLDGQILYVLIKRFGFWKAILILAMLSKVYRAIEMLGH